MKKKHGIWIEFFEFYFILCVSSILEYSTEENPVADALCLVDLDGFDMKQIMYVPNIILGIQMGLPYRNLALNHVGGAVIINGSFPIKNAQWR
jgi:hypothetical protein